MDGCLRAVPPLSLFLVDIDKTLKALNQRSWQSTYAAVSVIGEPKYLSWPVPNENKLSTVVQ